MRVKKPLLVTLLIACLISLPWTMVIAITCGFGAGQGEMCDYGLMKELEGSLPILVFFQTRDWGELFEIFVVTASVFFVLLLGGYLLAIAFPIWLERRFGAERRGDKQAGPGGPDAAA